MSILNRSTLKQKISDYINRVAPFTNPLIQKSENLEVSGDVADSAVLKQSTVGSISAPAASFNVDFAVNDEYNINSSASIPAAFNITLQNLENNSIGKLNITKKSGDVFLFANGVIVNHDGTSTGQAGTTTINLIVCKIGSNYFIYPSYLYQVVTAMIADAAITAEKLGTNSVTTAKINSAAVTTDKIAPSGSLAVNFTLGGATNYVLRLSGSSVVQWSGADTLTNTLGIFIVIGSSNYRPLVDSTFICTKVGSPNTVTIKVSTNGNVEKIAFVGGSGGDYDLSNIIYLTK
jgi:hypothetical protein